MDRDEIIRAVCASDCYQSEAKCIARSGWEVAERPRLVKVLENEKVRLIFPTRIARVEEGVVVGLVCLYELHDRRNVYAHAIFAGPTVNPALGSLFVPATQAKPQPGTKGNKAILQFVGWKRAAWMKFLNDELELGQDRASAIWIENFWRALDRMYGGGNLLDQTT